MSDHYDEIYWQDTQFTENEAHGWIQWKGTTVCMDVQCSCGANGHVDAEFFYRYECSKCGAKHAVGQNVKLIRLNDEQISEDATYIVGQFDE